VRHQLIRLDQVPETGTVTAELLGREILIMLQDGKPRAFVNVCMHHGGMLDLHGDRFICQWHGQEYEARTGRAIRGPARPDARLIMLPVRVEDGIVTYVYDE
jgi:nitrite reductase/ring-hydroxylating ferredoxin subunit